MSIPSPAFPEPAAVPTPGGSRLDAVLRLLTDGGRVSDKMRQSAQGALGSIPADEVVIDACRCAILSGVTKGEGVALLTTERLSVFERRGFRSVDQRFQLLLGKPFSIERGPGATQLVLAAAGGRPATIDFFDVSRAESVRDQLEVQRCALEKGWWSQVDVAWPGWLGTEPSWAYLGGDRHILVPATELRVHAGPTGITLGDTDGSTAPLTPWSAVSFLHVITPDEGFHRAAARGLLVSEAFAGAWRSEEWTAFLVVGYTSGEQAFLGTTAFSEADLRGRLFRVAAAMTTPWVEEPPAADASAQETVAQETVAQERVVEETVVEETPAVTIPGAEVPFDLATQLERLGVLHRQGLLDDTEFSKAKAALLGG